MPFRTPVADEALHEVDETAWLDATAELLRQGCLDEVDHDRLAEYLEDMARRDRREVESRLTVLLAHLLKWTHLPEERTNSWRATIVEQRQELESLVARGVLRNHALAVLQDVHRKAAERAAAETGLPESAFPAECPYKLDALLAAGLLEDA